MPTARETLNTIRATQGGSAREQLALLRTPLLEQQGITGAEVKRRAAADEPIVQSGIRRATAGQEVAATAIDAIGGLTEGVFQTAALAADIPMTAARLGKRLVMPNAEQEPLMPLSTKITEIVDKGTAGAKEMVGIDDGVALSAAGPAARFVGNVVAPGPEAALVGRLKGAPAAATAAVDGSAKEALVSVRQYLAQNPETPREARSLLFKDGLSPEQAAAAVPDVAPTPTAVKETTSQWTQRWTTETATALRRRGKVGNEIADKLFTVNREAAQMAARPVEALKALKKLSTEESEQFINLMEGKIRPDEATKRVQNLNTVHRHFLNQIGSEAERAGLLLRMSDGTTVPFAKRPDFYPHINPDRVDAPLFVGPSEIEPGARLGSLERVREGDAPYLRDPVTALATYYSSAARKLAEVRHFGADVGRAVDGYVVRASMAGEPTDFVRDALTRTLGGGPRINEAERGLASAAMNLQVLTKLPTAVIGNATQTAFTVSKAGFKNTAAAAMDLLKSKVFRDPAILDEALASGATLESLVNELVAGKHTDLLARGASGMLKATGFTVVERFNRLLAAQAGIRTAEELAAVATKQKALPWYGITGARDRAVRDLDRMGVDVQKLRETGVLSPQDRANAGFWMSHKTQFGTRFEDMPLGWSSSPIAKVMTQFKGFSFKAGKFMKDELVKPAIHGEVLPLARFVAAAGLFGGTTETARDFLFGQIQSLQDVDARKQVLDGITSMAMGNIVAGMFRSGQYGGARGLMEAVVGPTMSDAYRWATVGQALGARARDGITNAAEGHDPSALLDPLRETADEVLSGTGPVVQTMKRSVPITKIITNRLEQQ